MKLRTSFIVLAMLTFIIAAACTRKPTTNSAAPANANRPVSGKTPGPLPDRGYKAVITLSDAPAKLRTGQKETITVKVKNASDVFWWSRGGETNDRADNKFYIAIGDRWLDKDAKLLTEMDGRLGISKDLKPGEEVELPLAITAPKDPGDYILEVDVVQEQVAWFSDKGSPTARTKVTVIR
jgi:hypothetical protein